jgi:peptidoglycan-associated lipoprotein
MKRREAGEGWMKRLPIIVALTAGLAAAGCAKKQAASGLPPAPPAGSATADAGSGPPAGPTGSTVAPGSQADLIAKVGTDRVFFEYDSHELSAAARDILLRQARWLRDNPLVALTIEGHCDERGTREYNLALGDRRANSVKNFLAAQGVATARLRTISYGKERPEVQGSDEESYALNRRAVAVVVGGAVS